MSDFPFIHMLMGFVIKHWQVFGVMYLIGAIYVFYKERNLWGRSFLACSTAGGLNVINCLPCELLDQTYVPPNRATKFFLNVYGDNQAIPVCNGHARIYNQKGYKEISEDEYLLQQLKLKL